MSFNNQIIPFLAVFTLVGFLIGLFWAQRRVAKNRALDRQKLDNKIRGYERDLEKSRGELKVQRDEINTIKSELAATKGRLKSRENEIISLQEKIAGFENLEAESAAKESQLKSAKTELDSLRSNLSSAEARMRKPPEPDPKLLSELQTARHSLSSKENEIATLLGRVRELAPLSIQIKDRDLRLREAEMRHTEELKGKEDELGRLRSRLKSLEDDNRRAHSRTLSVETRLRELEASHQAELAAKNVEFERARTRIAELEVKLQAMSAHQALPVESEVRVQTAAGERDA
ncbi:MAG: hypothetical protein J2P31_02325 [Blastocatellia bacterium]|nr:hypothetical protein [Blastocatellia bacterium]